MTRDDMEQLTAHTDVKAERVRILYRAGASRSEIAAFLDISYQHVQNTLKRSGLLATPVQDEPAGALNGAHAFVALTLGRNNMLALPDELVSQAGLAAGDELVCTIESGRLVIMTHERAASLLMEAALRHMPGQADLLGTLLGRGKRPPSS